MPFPAALAEMQTASSSIWTLVANSISYNDNHYAKCASISVKMCQSWNIIVTIQDIVNWNLVKNGFF